MIPAINRNNAVKDKRKGRRSQQPLISSPKRPALLDPRQGTYPQDKEPHQASWDHHQGPLRIGDKGRTLGGTTMNGWSKQWTDKGVYPIRWIKETEGDK